MARRKGVQARDELHFPEVNPGPDGLIVDERTPLVRFNSRGEQILESTPVEVPLGWNAPESIEVTIARMVRAQLSVAADAAGYETLEEAYDFDMADNDDFEEHLTPHELHAMVHAPEMTEEWPREQVDGGRAEERAQAPGGSRTGDAGFDKRASGSSNGKDASDKPGAADKARSAAGRAESDGSDGGGAGKGSG